MCDKRKENSLKLTIIFYVWYLYSHIDSLNDIQYIVGFY